MPTTPEETVSAFVECMQSRNLPGILALYEPDALFIPAAGPRATGHAALAEAFRATFALNPTIEATPSEVLVNGDLAWLANRWRFRGDAPDGTRIDQSGCSSVTLRRSPDGTWRIAIDRL
jgi:uncharacterized protein (TIGR02246 family)